MELLRAMKITLFFAVTLLIGSCIDLMSKDSVDPELLSLGSFDMPVPLKSCPKEVQLKHSQSQLDVFLVQPYRNTNVLSLLPNLTELRWPDPVHAPFPAGSLSINKTVRPLPEPFEPVMSKGQVALCRRLLRMFSDFMFAHGYGDRFWLNGGTLVGSLHHHDFIPWDDDVDVLADADLRPTIQKFLQQLKPEYEWYAMWERDKLFTRPLNASSQVDTDLELSRPTSDKSWPWPFLDIGYYKRGLEDTCLYLGRPGQSVCFPNSFIFPLIYRPFGKEWYPAPSNTLMYLRSNYQMRSSCVTFGYSHIFELGSSFARVPCYTLAGKYAFTRHCPLTSFPLKSVANPALAGTFVMNHERLMVNTSTGWKVVHTLNIPMKYELNVCQGYGVPEPR